MHPLRLLAALLAFGWLLPAGAPAQVRLPMLGDTSLELPVVNEPAEAVKIELREREEQIEERLGRMQERTSFVLERLDLRSRDLREQEERFSERRNALLRVRGARQRQEALAAILNEIRAIRQTITRIEEVWVSHLDDLADSQSEASRYRLKVDRIVGLLEESHSPESVAEQLEAVEEQLIELRRRVDEMEQERTGLLKQTDAHRALLEEARRVLRERDLEMLDRSAAPAVLVPEILGDLPDPGESEEPEEPETPEEVMTDAERELLSLGDTLATLQVSRMERERELDRVLLARLEAQIDHQQLEVPVLEFARDAWGEKRADLAQRAADGLLGRRPPLLSGPVISQATDHTAGLLLSPQGTLEEVVARIRPSKAQRRQARPGTLIAVFVVGVLGMGLVLRNRGRIGRIQPRSKGEALGLHALYAALPLLPIALVSVPLYALDLVPEALQPLYRFSGWAPAVVAALVATGVSLFPEGGTENMSASVARYARFLVRFGAAVTCVFGLINTVLPLFGYSEQTRTLLRGVSLGWVLLVWLLLMVRKQEILSLVGATGNDPKEGMIKAGIRRLYGAAALGPLAVYLLYASGYANLAGFLVQGGLVTLAVLMLAPWLHETLMGALAKAIGYPDGGGMLALEKEAARAGYRALAPLVMLFIGLSSVLLILAGWNSGQRLGDLGSVITRPLFEIGGSNVSIGSLLLLGLTIAITLVISRQFNRLLNTVVYPIYALDKGMRSTMDTLAGYVVLVVGLVVCLDVVGLGVGFLTVFAGVVGIGVGFGSQTLAANFIAGLILLFTRPLTVDDVIEVSGVTGRVVRIAPFSTVVRTLDNLDVVIPNSDLLGGTVVNWTGDENQVRIKVGVGVAYGSDVALVERLLIEAMQKEPRVLRRPRPAVRFDGFGDSSLDFTMLPWIDDPEQRYVVSSALRHLVDAAFREHGVEIPFPQTDIHLRAGDATLQVALERGYEVRGEDGVIAEADAGKQKAARKAKATKAATSSPNGGAASKSANAEESAQAAKSSTQGAESSTKRATSAKASSPKAG